MSNNPDPSVPPGQTPPGTDPTGQTPNQPEPTPPAGQQKTSIDSLPSDIQDYIKRLRDEAEEANKQKKAEARAKQQAEEQRLKEQGEYKELAEQHELRINELEPLADRYSMLAQLVMTQIDAQVKDWPEVVKIFDPGKDADVCDRLSWVNKSQPHIADLQQQARGSAPGNSPNPRPVASTPDDARNEFTKKLRASGKYGA